MWGGMCSKLYLVSPREMGKSWNVKWKIRCGTRARVFKTTEIIMNVTKGAFVNYRLTTAFIFPDVFLYKTNTLYLTLRSHFFFQSFVIREGRQLTGCYHENDDALKQHVGIGA